MTWQNVTPSTLVYCAMAVASAVFFIKLAIDARKWVAEDREAQQHWMDE